MENRTATAVQEVETVTKTDTELVKELVRIAANIPADQAVRVQRVFEIIDRLSEEPENAILTQELKGYRKEDISVLESIINIFSKLSDEGREIFDRLLSESEQ